jgi:uncharacterized repeat protein (TIGR02543 family)
MTALAAGSGLSSSATEVGKGGNFTVTVTVPAITELLANVQLDVNFDNTVFAVASSYVPDSAATSSNTYSEANTTSKVSIIYAPGENSVNFSSGYTFTVPFTVLDTATVGSKNITLTTDLSSLDTDGYTSIDREPSGMVKSVAVTVTLPANNITVTGNPSRAYNGLAISNPDVSKTSTDGTVSYEWFNDNSGAVGTSLGTTAPTNAGKYWVKASVTGSATHADATSAAKAFTISRADYSFTPSVTNNVTVGNSYPVTDATVKGDGVNSEKVDGTLTWYTDSGCTAAATGTFTTAGSTMLYWKFTPSSGETNYITDAKTGSTTFTVSSLPAQTFNTGFDAAMSKTYGDVNDARTASLVSGQGTGAISYASDNTAVATVDSSFGEVTIKGAGTAHITATAAEVAGTWAKTSVSYTLTVSPKAINVTVDPATRKFGEANPTFTATVPSGSLVGTDTIDGLGLGLTTTATAASDVGSYNVTGDGTYNANYNVTIIGTDKLVVGKADHAGDTASANVKYNVTAEQTVDLSGKIPTNCGTISSIAVAKTSADQISAVSGDAAAKTVKFALNSGLAEAVYTNTLTAKVTTQNYADYDIVITVNIAKKDVPTGTANNITVTYTGSPVPATAITGTMNVPGTWGWKGTPSITSVADSGTKTVVFTPTDSTNYAAVEKDITVTINKATPTGTPSYKTISASGKTLADAALAIGTITPTGGTIAWKDNKVTTVAANTAYQWTYTPAAGDQANYNTLTGSITPYVVSGGSGGGVSSYTLTFNTNGGSKIAAVSKTSGTAVDLTAYKPTRDGYLFAGWFSDAALTKAVTSVKLTANTTIYAKWSLANPFADVPDGAYYHDAVLWAVGKKVTDGTTPTTFSPAEDCTRAQVVTFLWRAMGSPEPAGKTNPFTDVSPDAYYYKAVLWAVEQGITKGTSDTAFSPNEAVTRAQFVTFLWRAAKLPTAGGANPFADMTDPDAYYYQAVLWAAEKSITTGTTPTTFNPGDVCNRGQVVTFLYRYLGK